MKLTQPLVLGAVVVAGSAGFAVAGAGAKSAATGKADSGTAYVSIVHSAGGKAYAAGYETDKLFGGTTVSYVIKASAGPTAGSVEIKANPVTLYTKTGELVGTGSGVETFAATGDTVTDGKLDLTKGTGAQKGHSFVGTFTGTENAKTDVFTFTYKGTYK